MILSVKILLKLRAYALGRRGSREGSSQGVTGPQGEAGHRVYAWDLRGCRWMSRA